MPVSSKAVTLFLSGDVMLGRGIDQILPSPCEPRLHEDYVHSALGYVALAERANGPVPRPAGFGYVWGAAQDEWRRIAPDLRIVNLETSITRSSAYIPKGINYRMSPENVGCVLAASIDCCVLANNHVLDWGEAGLIETLETLRRHNIRVAGAGRNLVEAADPAFLDLAGKGRVIVYSFATMSSGVPAEWAATRTRPGVNLLPNLSETVTRRIVDELRSVKRSNDIVIVSIHWGPNWGYEIPEEQRRFAHALIDRAGVAVVHGHSSHHPKAIEVYRRRLILFGCGDFLNDYEGIAGYEEFRGDLACMYFVSLDVHDGAMIQLEITPLQIRRLRLNGVTRDDAEWLRQTLHRESSRFGTGIEWGPDGRFRVSWNVH